MLESIFDLFVQSTRTFDESAGGLGVGLTLVRALVGMHGGMVTVTSAGTGKAASSWCGCRSRRSFRRVTPRRPNRVRVRAFGAAPRSWSSKTAPTVAILCELLAQEGFECATAESGTAALELIDRLRPAIAILDVGLPGMDGFELARRLRSNREHADMFLIALTGYGQASDRAAGREAGFDEHLVKPVNVERLLKLAGAPDQAARRRSTRERIGGVWDSERV